MSFARLAYAAAEERRRRSGSIEEALARLGARMGLERPPEARRGACPERVATRPDGRLACPVCRVTWDRDDERPACAAADAEP